MANIAARPHTTALDAKATIAQLLPLIVQKLFEPRHDLGMIRRHVLLLSWIQLQIE
jgi:hypothetical protein